MEQGINKLEKKSFYEEFSDVKMRLEIWVSGANRQIDRLKKDLKNMNIAENEIEKWSWNVSRINDDNFLRIAVNNSIKWLKEFNKFIIETNDIYKELSNERDIKDLRNMTEHDIEYYYEKGHYQNRYINKKTNLCAFDTGITENDYLIGGRLSLKYIEDKFENLGKILKEGKFTMNMSYIMRAN